MLLQDMIKRVVKDLKITDRKARAYVDLFHRTFEGNYSAITHLSATYTDNGKVRMSYIIGGKKSHLVLNSYNPYEEENRKRATTRTNGEQIVQLLGKLYPNVSPKEWEDGWVNTFEFEANGCVIHIRVDEIPSLDETVAALKSCGINLSSVGIENRYGHLTITITNFNNKTKEDINFIND